MKNLASDQCHNLIATMMLDPKIREKVFAGKSYKIYSILPNKDLILGHTSVKWWNQLIHCQDKLEFPLFAFRVWEAFLSMSEGVAKTAIDEGLAKEIVNGTIRKADYDKVIQRLWDIYTHVCNTEDKTSGHLKLKHDDYKPSTIFNNDETVVNVNVGGVKKVIKFKDSVGAPFIDVVLGPVDVIARHGR